MRALGLCCATLLLAHVPVLHAQAGRPASLPLLDVPFVSQSEALCGGAAAAMVMRFWGARGVSAESFAHLVDRSAAGIHTDALIDELQARGWRAAGVSGRADLVRRELLDGRPVMLLIEDRPSTFHYIVVVAWHDRGVVFHDPARAPFRVMPQGELDRRWDAAGRWMAVMTPGEATVEAVEPSPPVETSEPAACGPLVAEGVRQAQAGDLAAAERMLTRALSCPGPEATRELAGVRLLQRRWPEVADLASMLVAEDETDDYAWKLLATSRYVGDDRVGALRAWNRAGEPRHDLLQVEGLVHTRHRVVETLVGVAPGTVLTPSRLVRARRRLAELPSASSTRLDYAPAPSGLAELRAAVNERPLLPSGRASLLLLGVSAAANRELRVTAGAVTGGGEAISAAWRFWPGRPRVALGVRAPSPWGGIMRLDAYTERQPFSDRLLSSASRTGVGVGLASWATAWGRWEASAGADRWDGRGLFGRAGGGARVMSLGDRLEAAARADVWLGDARFAVAEASLRARSSAGPRGFVVLGTAGAAAASGAAPLDLWPAGDTGHARPSLLRAHPLIDDGRLRADRLGRTLVHASIEARRWWSIRGLVRLAPALFTDAGRTARRREHPPIWDVDAGAGLRLGVAGMTGMLTLDVARGLRDGATAVSLLYQP